ncbi:Tat pathway signal sequence domain protein [Sphingomonas gilva]|uniref:Tat pathway signal sequence domain protein n=1 Tax=Sphingomonas gilva TaxID=2305907 RepID=A0A396RM33_9SPHN|nr:DUF6250 domain-containing protein [Sphingomonas gilva]RHW17454.1 Tat pathway signal sequence domain protein [Sphingomonas gilva]
MTFHVSSLARSSSRRPGFLFALAGLLAACAPVATATSDRSAWRIEAESPEAVVRFDAGVIDIDTPRGLSLWYRQALTAPVTISFEAMAVAEGGANDEVSDLNAFWMATNEDGTPVLDRTRSGAFAEYDTLRTYYVGIGGNRNTTTRFRRYIGKPGDRPLLPEHDRGDQAAMLVPNRWMRIALIADGRRIAVRRDGELLFALDDPEPYTRGHFAIRTTKSHIRIRNLEITRP